MTPVQAIASALSRVGGLRQQPDGRWAYTLDGLPMPPMPYASAIAARGNTLYRVACEELNLSPESVTAVAARRAADSIQWQSAVHLAWRLDQGN